MSYRNLLLAAAALVASAPVAAAALTPEQEACIGEHVRKAAGDMTMNEVRAFCGIEAPAEHHGMPQAPEIVSDPDAGIVSQRLEEQRLIEGEAWAIEPYKANFILPFAYNSSFDSDLYKDFGYSNADNLKDYEAVFQISMMMPLWYGLYKDQGDLYFAFTSRAWWQVYDDASAPFRETNYEPEIFARFMSGREILGMRNVANSIGLVHQSNGRDVPLSRSWNRVFAAFTFEKGNFAFQLKPWYRIPEDEEDDDNPNIERYVGYADYVLGWAPGDHRISAVLRNNLKSWDENKGSIELNYSYPIWGGLRLYLQYFNGYGDGLIYYNENTNRIGIGIALNDIL